MQCGSYGIAMSAQPSHSSFADQHAQLFKPNDDWRRGGARGVPSGDHSGRPAGAERERIRAQGQNSVFPVDFSFQMPGEISFAYVLDKREFLDI